MQTLLLTSLALWAITALLVTGLCAAAKRGDTA
jgi:hypothetical protein